MRLALKTLSCRPIYMLDTAEKVLERLIRGRLAEVVYAAGYLSPRQFSFSAERSIVEVVIQIVDTVHKAVAHN